MTKTNFAKVFAIRSVISFALIIMLLLISILRVAVVATNNYSDIAFNQSLYRINIAKLRGTIYDCNLNPITNATTKKVAAISPTTQAIAKIRNQLTDNQLKETLEILKSNKPAICTVDNDISDAGISTATVYNNSQDYMTACHIIGYTDDSGHGVSGLQKAYDHLLYSEKYLSAVFTVDGKGNVLEGVSPYFENDLSVLYDGVITTLDLDIQKIAENAISNFASGCVIVADAKNSKIRAMASVPDFNVNNIAESLNGENSPMLNRAILSYSVGSVFKPIIAATAIENGKISHTFNCTGSTKIVDRFFKCHKLDGHGEVDMCTALSQSCNCYFYDIAMQIKVNLIYKKMAALSFNSQIRIAENLYTSKGNTPKLTELDNYGTVANISIGQGSLQASPIAMLNLYCAIAGDGSYYLPSIVEATIKRGNKTAYDIGNKTKVMESSTAEILREFLKSVITDGTGVEAQTQYCTCAGKTATAQTGRYNEDGTEITNSWFCGFFPADNPRYVAVVMSDSKPNVSTAAVFAQIADEIMQLDVKNGKNND